MEHPLPPQVTGRAHSDKCGSVDQDLIHLASHNHSWYKSDNEKVYFALEEATQGIVYSTVIKLHQINKDGRNAF